MTAGAGAVAAASAAAGASAPAANRPAAHAAKGSGDAFGAFLRGAVDAAPAGTRAEGRAGRGQTDGGRSGGVRHAARATGQDSAAAGPDAAVTGAAGTSQTAAAIGATDGGTATVAVDGTQPGPATALAVAASATPVLAQPAADAAATDPASTIPASETSASTTAALTAAAVTADSVSANTRAPSLTAPATAAAATAAELAPQLTGDAAPAKPAVRHPGLTTAGVATAASPTEPAGGTAAGAGAAAADTAETGAPAPRRWTGAPASPAPQTSDSPALSGDVGTRTPTRIERTGHSGAPSQLGAPRATTVDHSSTPPSASMTLPGRTPSAPATGDSTLGGRPKSSAGELFSAPATPVAGPAPAPLAVDRAVPAPPVAPPAPTASTAPPLAGQLARPVFTLAAAGTGEHVMTVHVTPDTLGPVTVRAHVGGEGVRVELFAPTDAGRDALRAILPDLRRDLSGAGLAGTLDLSSQNQPAPQHDAAGGGREQPREVGDEPAPRRAPTASTRSAPAAPADGAPHTIDLIV